MLLAGPNLKVVPVTIHLSLKDAIGVLTTEEIARTLEITINSLKFDYGISHPRIAVSALTPMQARAATWVERKSTLSAPPSTGFQT